MKETINCINKNKTGDEGKSIADWCMCASLDWLKGVLLSVSFPLYYRICYTAFAILYRSVDTFKAAYSCWFAAGEVVLLSAGA